MQRMYEQQFLPEDVINALKSARRIKEYPDDKPLPSALMLVYLGSSPLHIVVGINEMNKDCVVITVYVPEPEIWTPDFTIKRKIS